VSFVLSNPILRNDPSGHCPPLIVIIAWIAANADWLGPMLLYGGVAAYGGIQAARAHDTQGVVTSILAAPLFIAPMIDPVAPETVESEAAAENSRLLFRSMKMGEDDLPEVGPTGRTLGARVPPNKYVDIRPDSEDMVHPNTGGMSASPDSVYNLDDFHRPQEYDGKGKDPVWCIYECDLGPNLKFNPDTSKHGFIEPVSVMSEPMYQEELAATRERWHLYHGQ
jgi:hypothetical protein